MCISQSGRQPPHVVFIGSGNVATHLAREIEKCHAGHISQVYSRNLDNARLLADKLESAEAINELSQIQSDADIYVISVKDDGIAELIEKLPSNNALWLHTSGSVPMEALSKLSSRYGVFYPMQTFSKNACLDMSEVPLFVEGVTNDIETEISDFASKIFQHVYHADSELRRKMHIAAVFSCNFTNYMWVIADELLQKEGLSFDIMRPLIKETLHKALTNSPEKGQTGPAIRGDKHIMEKHQALLPEPEREIYRLISTHIFNHFN